MASSRSHVLDTAARYLLLPLLSAFGYYSTHMLSQRTGFFDLIKRESIDILKLPGTDVPLKTTYTGVPQIDRLFTIFAAVFWPAIDGSDPSLSLQAAHFAGQAMAMWIIIEIEGRRRGNAWKLVCLYDHPLPP